MDTYSATSVGTTMLVVAAAIVVLTFVFQGPLWRPNLGIEQPLRAATATSKETSRRETSHRIAPSPLPATQAASTSSGSTASQTTARVAANPAEDGSSLRPTSDKPQATKAATTPSTSERSSQPVAVFNEADPWAATRCVHVFNPDLSEPTRWKVENGCDTPVGVVVADRSIILPTAAQRPVTLEEQTVRAQSVRHTACFVATSKAMALIGAPSETRSTPEWREQFESARVSDGCLSRLKGKTN